jgi:hypothetical protein
VIYWMMRKRRYRRQTEKKKGKPVRRRGRESS